MFFRREREKEINLGKEMKNMIKYKFHFNSYQVGCQHGFRSSMVL